MLSRRELFTYSTAIGVTAATGDSPIAARAAEGDATAEAPGFYRFPLGELRVTVLCDGVFFLPSDSIATNAAAEERKSYFESRYLPPDQFRLQANPVVIETADKRVLVDAGLAPKEQWAQQAGRLVKALGDSGITPDSIDIVVLTHCHPDHVGGLAAQIGLFPKAEVALSGVELDLWTTPGAEARLPDWAVANTETMQSLVKSLGDRIRTMKAGDDVVTGVTSLDSSGHTEGHISLLVGSGSDQLLITGDAVPSIHVSFERPEWQIVWDHDREKGARTRRSLLDRSAHDRLLVCGYHYPFPGVGHVVKDGQGFRWLPADWVWHG